MIAATIEIRHNAAGGPLATVPHPPDDEPFSMVFERESDGRWLAEVPELPGVMADGTSEQDDEVNVTALALQVIADRTEQIRTSPKSIRFLGMRGRAGGVEED
ncbi:MAG TPA: type II toxin-antitoxin system HicB family antitoxin [Candidatus Sulfotelmatobacter sp.]|jgi:predicted RNase H-like HicB family nuclease